MAAETKIAFQNVFADDSKSTLTITNIKKSNLNLTDIENKVKAFNAAKGGELSTKMKSKNGFNWVGITKVTVTTNDRTYIF